ncbi:MAG: ribonuclease HI [Deltaproteobacteria bacterium]|nr:ribonuclease HI [Deltaproteobacteria bacterium]
MPWMRHKLRDQDVWAKVDARGALATDSAGRVEVVYKAAPGAKVYRASSRNLAPLGGDPIEIETDAPLVEAAATTRAAAPVGKAIPADAIHVWTDGACTGNPGPAAVGVVVIDDGARRELSEYLGDGTNNIAELTAIARGLAMVADPKRPVVVYSDSAYAIGLLSKGWKAKANVDLVAALRKQLAGFDDVRFVKVKGHAGVPENERCDQLARDAIVNRR